MAIALQQKVEYGLVAMAFEDCRPVLRVRLAQMGEGVRQKSQRVGAAGQAGAGDKGGDRLGRDWQRVAGKVPLKAPAEPHQLNLMFRENDPVLIVENREQDFIA